MFEATASGVAVRAGLSIRKWIDGLNVPQTHQVYWLRANSFPVSVMGAGVKTSKKPLFEVRSHDGWGIPMIWPSPQVRIVESHGDMV